MPGLHTVTAHGLTTGVSDVLLETLLALPHLTSVTLLDTPTITCPVPFPRFPGPLECLTYGQTESQPPEYDADMLSKMRALNLFLLTHTYHADTIQSLHIPGELAMPGFLAGVPWTALTALELHGYPPVIHDSELVRFLAAAPNLVRLRIQLARTQTTKKFMVWRPEHQSMAVPSSFLEKLVLLSLFCPDAEDLLFGYLPSTLQELDLRIIPEPSPYRVTENTFAPRLTADQLRRIFQLRSLHNLRTLRISMDTDLKAMTLIAGAFPFLEVLELQFLTDQHLDNSEPAHIVIAHTLAPLRQLFELRIHLVTTGQVLGNTANTEADIESTEWIQHMRYMARSLKSLRRIIRLEGSCYAEVAALELRDGRVHRIWNTLVPAAVSPSADALAYD